MLKFSHLPEMSERPWSSTILTILQGTKERGRTLDSIQRKTNNNKE